jgi:hypothetical protein
MLIIMVGNLLLLALDPDLISLMNKRQDRTQKAAEIKYGLTKWLKEVEVRIAMLVPPDLNRISSSPQSKCNNNCLSIFTSKCPSPK